MIKVSQYGNNSGTRKPQNSSTLTENRNKSIVDSSLSEKKAWGKGLYGFNVFKMWKLSWPNTVFSHQ